MQIAIFTILFLTYTDFILFILKKELFFLTAPNANCYIHDTVPHIHWFYFIHLYIYKKTHWLTALN